MSKYHIKNIVAQMVEDNSTVASVSFGEAGKGYHAVVDITLRHLEIPNKGVIYHTEQIEIGDVDNRIVDLVDESEDEGS